MTRTKLAIADDSRAAGDVSDGLDRLKGDLDSGEWTRRYAHLPLRDGHDCGYRLVCSR